MNPFGTRARSDELDRVLGGAPAGGLAPYAAVAGRLRTAATVLEPTTGPSPEFRTALRTRLLAVAAVQAHNNATAPSPRGLEAAASWTQARRTQRRLGVAAGAMASVVALAGVAVAGSQSLPGDPFYGVKKGGEALELRTAGSDAAKGSKHLEFAATRLHEVRGLTLGRDAALGPLVPGQAGALGGSTSERVRTTLAVMDDETRKGSALLLSAYRDSSDQAPLRVLDAFASSQGADLRELLADAPTAVRPRLQDSLLIVTGVGAEASELLAVGACTTGCSPDAAAPTLPPVPGATPQPTPGGVPCGCAPVAEPSAEPTPTSTPAPARTATTEPSASATAGSSPASSPSRTPQPSSSPLPLPTPSLPVPLPTLPIPLPTLPVPLPTLSPLVLPSLLPSLLG